MTIAPNARLFHPFSLAIILIVSALLSPLAEPSKNVPTSTKVAPTGPMPAQTGSTFLAYATTKALSVSNADPGHGKCEVTPSSKQAEVKGSLRLEIIEEGSKVRAILANSSDGPLDYRDVLHRHNNELGYPWMSLQFRNRAGKELLIPGLGTSYWSPYLITNHVFDFLSPVESLEQLAGGQSVEVTATLRDLMRGLPDKVRLEAVEVLVSFAIPLDKNLRFELRAETEWFTLPPKFKAVDLLHGQPALGTVYAD